MNFYKLQHLHVKAYRRRTVKVLVWAECVFRYGGFNTACDHDSVKRDYFKKDNVVGVVRKGSMRLERPAKYKCCSLFYSLSALKVWFWKVRILCTDGMRSSMCSFNSLWWTFAFCISCPDASSIGCERGCVWKEHNENLLTLSHIWSTKPTAQKLRKHVDILRPRFKQSYR